jgi:hypothetical protein
LIAMTALSVRLTLAAGWLAATLLTACVSSPDSAGTSPGPLRAGQSAVDAMAKLTKHLSGAQVRALLGPPATTQPIAAGGAQGETWSYPSPAGTEVRLIEVATQQVPAVDPFSGQTTTRAEPLYQNQSVDVTDTLHLLLVDDRLVEWRVVRDEQKRF